MDSAKVFLTDLVHSGIRHVPSRYVRPISERPNLLNVQTCQHAIPFIDLQGFNGPNHSRIIKEIQQACEHYGFFQVKNHGLPERVTDNMLRVAKEFFKLPETERLKVHSNDPSRAVRLSTSFNVKAETTANWRDFLRLHCYPLDDYIHEWPSNPSSFRELVGEYCTNVRELSLRLLEAISESLGLQSDYINKALQKHAQHMAINYYPPCPQPELTYGLPIHSDPNVITVLLQDNVPGLQVLKDGKWIAVNPIPNTFIINIGDQIEVLSNGRYKSVLHRAVVNCNKERISVPTFYCPSPVSVIKPAQELVDEEHPLFYRSFTYNEYYTKFWNRGLATENCLDMFRAPST